MSEGAVPLRPRRVSPALPLLGRIQGALSSPHARGVAILLLLAVWLARRLLFTSALPAGTDMLGFVARARENADWGHMLSLWTPSSFGGPRPYTLDVALGLLTRLTGDPAVTVKVLVVSTFLTGGLLTYLLSWRWYRSVLAATVTGVLFMTSQSFLTRWGSGLLNVETTFALAPLLLLLWDACLERFSVARGLALGAASAAVLHVRLDMALYATPFLLIQVVVLAAAGGRPRAVLINAGRGAAVALATTAALALGQILPLAGGVRATWASGTRLFDAQDFTIHSLGAFQSLVGLGREIGYLAFTGQQTWESHPWLPTWLYLSLAAVIPALAFGALWVRRDPRTVFLVVVAILAAFLGKGFRPPLGEPYRWAIDNVPLFGNLRNPNRWLVFQALAYAALAGVTVTALVGRLRAAGRPAARRLAAPVVGVLLAAALVGVAPELVSGFRTWRPLPDQVALLDEVAKDHGDFRVATVPYDQALRFVQQDGYRGFEHDLGGDSSVWTRHPAVVDGGWQPASADFVAFTSTLLRHRDVAFARLLGTVGVKRLVSFAYKPTAPHLIAGEADPLYQQQAVAGMPGLAVQTSNGAGSIYGVPSWSPLVSVRRLAVVLGGAAGLAGLADMPGIDLRQWVAVTAPDALRRGGLDLLVRLMRSASLVVVANERTRDLGLLATPALGRIPPISSDAGLDHLTELLPSDGSIRAGALSDPTVAPAPPRTSSSSSVIDLGARARSVELWSRVQVGPSAAQLTYRIDGRTVRRVTPLAMRPAFRWIRAFAGLLPAGRHHLSILGSRSPYGEAMEVDESKVVDPGALAARTARLRATMHAVAPRTAYSLDLADVQRSAVLVHRYSGSVLAGQRRPGFWRVIEPRAVAVDLVPGRRHTIYARLDVRGGRRAHTLVEHDFARPQRWGHIGYLFLTYRGTGGGQRYRLTVDFNRAHRRSVPFELVDDQPGGQTRAFAIGPLRRDRLRADWDHVTGIRLAADDLRARGGLQLGQLSLDRPISYATVAFPVAPLHTPRQLRLFDPARPGPGRLAGGIGPGATKIRWLLTESQLDANLRLQTVVPRAELASDPGGRVRYRRTGATSFDVRTDAPAGSWLLLGEGFDPGWKLRLAGKEIRPLPGFSLLNAYRLPPGRHTGTVAYTGDRLGHRGLALSALAALIVAAALVSMTLRRRARPVASAEDVPVRVGPASSRRPVAGDAVTVAAALVAVVVVSVVPEPPGRLAVSVALLALLAAGAVAWRILLAFTLALIVATPLASRLLPSLDPDRVAILALAALAIVVVAAANDGRALRRRRHAP